MLALYLLQLTGWQIGNFSRTGIDNPILKPSETASFSCPMRGESVRFEHDHVFNPAAVVHNGKVYLLYRAEDDHGAGIGGHTSRIGLAISDDGLNFKKRATPVLYPDNDSNKKYEWPGGCEDPRVVEGPQGEYVLTYTAWDRKTARLCVATSRDLVHWTKHGPVFSGTPFLDTWSKSGAVVTVLKHDRLVAAKIKGKYWMYWGEGTLNLASSTDLIHWSPSIGSDGKLLGNLTTRVGMFDSALVESGPPAILTKDGIVLIYNGKNDKSNGDTDLGDGAYAAGQALFDRNDPGRVIDRCQTYFIKPDLQQEKTGQYTAGTVFTEALVHFRGRWILYFGSADSYVGAARTR